MKKITGFFCIAILFAACKKGNDPTQEPPQTPSNNKIKWSVYGGSTDTATYEYYTDGLEKKYSFPNGQRTETVKSPGKITVTSYTVSGSVISITEHILNANGLRDSLKFNSTTFATVFEYNSNMECTRIRTVNTQTGALVTESLFYYLNGNRIKDSSSSGNITLYEYYTDKVSTIEDNPNVGRLYMAKGNKNCKKKETYIAPFGVISVTDYTYEFDASGRVTRFIYSGTSSNGSVYFGYY
jgi:hypothetical protein